MLLVLLLAVLVCVYYFVVSSLLLKIKNAGIEIQKKEIDQNYSRSKLAELDILKKQFELIDSNKHKLDVVFSEDQIIFLIERLEKMARETNNEITIEVSENIKKEEKKKASGKNDSEEKNMELPSENYMAMSIKLTGDYGSLRDFIYKLEHMDYLSDIVSVEISTKNKSSVNKQSVFSSSNSLSENGERDGNEDENKVYSRLETVFYLWDWCDYVKFINLEKDGRVSDMKLNKE